MSKPGTADLIFGVIKAHERARASDDNTLRCICGRWAHPSVGHAPDWDRYIKHVADELEHLVAELAVAHARSCVSQASVIVPRRTAEYAATALEASSDNGDRYAATQIRFALLHAAP